MTDLRDEPVDVEVVQSDLVYQGRVWDVRNDLVHYNDGEFTRQYVDHTGAVAVVALDAQGRVALIQQYRHPIRQRDWEIPAGLLDVAGEPPIDAARRELAEEVDLVAGSMDALLSIYTTPGGNNEMVHIFLAQDLSPTPEAFRREDEEADIRLEWVPLGDAIDAVLAGRMHNGILAAGLFATAERLRRGSAPTG